MRLTIQHKCQHTARHRIYAGAVELERLRTALPNAVCPECARTGRRPAMVEGDGENIHYYFNKALIW